LNAVFPYQDDVQWLYYSDFDELTVAEMIYIQKNNLNEVFPNPDRSGSCKSQFYMANNMPEILCSETHKMLQLKGQWKNGNKCKWYYLSYLHGILWLLELQTLVVFPTCPGKKEFKEGLTMGSCE